MTETAVYDQLIAQARSLLGGESDRVANAANLSALIFAALNDVNWAGFYFLKGRELVVGPFQGLPACVRLPIGKGVCGTAAAECRTVIVDDVHAFDGHIACDAASASEIVIPLIDGKRLVGVLDVDSPLRARFTDADRRGLETVAKLYVDTLKPAP